MPSMSVQTRTGPPKLSEVAKHLAVPVEIASTGWPAVRHTCVEKLGVEFDPWQDGAGRVILAKREDGSLAAMIDGVGLSLPRQVGKTYLIGALVFALCVNMPGLLVIWTAQHLATSGETFLAMQGFAARQKVAPHVKFVHTGKGDEEIRFHNGSRILFGARERGFGRGIPGVDVLIFDEAQILSDKAMSNMLATMNTSRFGLQLYIGTPPKPEDQSETFKRMRREALAGTLPDGAWIELGADPDADGDDREQWRKANPSYPHRTPAQSMLRLKRKLTAADWKREALGIWDDDQAGSRLITTDEWASTGIVSPPSEGLRAIAVAFSQDGHRAAVAGGLRPVDEPVHVELVDDYSGPMSAGVASLAEWISERKDSLAQIVLSGRAGADALRQALVDRGVSARQILVASTPQYLSACSGYYDAVRDRTVTHSAIEGQARLDESVAVCDKKIRTNDGAWGWEATTPNGDETPVEAVCLAWWAAKTTKRRAGRKARALL